MFYCIIKATPEPDTEDAQQFTFAYVYCWIDFKEDTGAEMLARFYIEEQGWIAGEIKDAFAGVTKEDFSDPKTSAFPESPEYFDQAVQYGFALVFHIALDSDTNEDLSNRAA